MEFEWDDAKEERNLRKHCVAFSEAATVFGDPLAVTFPDVAHSEEEDRYLTIGKSIDGRLIVLCHTDRGEKTRIISAREATRTERRGFEDGTYP